MTIVNKLHNSIGAFISPFILSDLQFGSLLSWNSLSRPVIPLRSQLPMLLWVVLLFLRKKQRLWGLLGLVGWTHLFLLVLNTILW